MDHLPLVRIMGSNWDRILDLVVCWTWRLGPFKHPESSKNFISRCAKRPRGPRCRPGNVWQEKLKSRDCDNFDKAMDLLLVRAEVV